MFPPVRPYPSTSQPRVSDEPYSLLVDISTGPNTGRAPKERKRNTIHWSLSHSLNMARDITGCRACQTMRVVPFLCINICGITSMRIITSGLVNIPLPPFRSLPSFYRRSIISNKFTVEEKGMSFHRCHRGRHAYQTLMVIQNRVDIHDKNRS